MSLTVLIPMAGQGKRFQDEGYDDPKPFIEVSEKPMIIQAVNALPKGDRYVFVCRTEHVQEYGLEALLKSNFSEIKIIPIDYLTQGQASTCLLAEGEVEPESQLLIGPCDNGMSWNLGKFNSMRDDCNIDVLVWTFRNNVTVRHKPQMYGWVAVDGEGRAQKISCKVPISKDPVHDHAIVGTFWFRKASCFFECTKRMIAKNRSTNNEFYVDEVMNEAIEDNLNVKVFEIDKYICWGTPNDLRVYEYWEKFFKEGQIK